MYRAGSLPVRYGCFIPNSNELGRQLIRFRDFRFPANAKRRSSQAPPLFYLPPPDFAASSYFLCSSL
jgi:hypothetical protein